MGYHFPNILTSPTIQGTVDAGTGLTFPAFTVGSADGIDIDPGSDVDADLITVNVTGTPRFYWDESVNRFVFSKGFTVQAGSIVGSGYLIMSDDVDLYLGGGSDYWFVYNSTGSQLELWSTDVDGSGTDGLIFSVDDGTDDVEFAGKLTTKGHIISEGHLYLNTTGKSIFFGNSDSEYIKGLAYDNTVGTVEICRWEGAADPYFQVGRDDGGVATNAVTDMLVLQAGAGNNNEAAGQGFGLPVKLGNAASEVEERASLDWVLATATNGAEDADLNLNLMNGGAMNLAAILDSAGTFQTDLDSDITANATGADIFDDYDDALILKNYYHPTMREETKQKLIAMGIATDDGKGNRMISWDGVRALTWGAIGQLYDRIQSLEAELQSLRS